MRRLVMFLVVGFLVWTTLAGGFWGAPETAKAQQPTPSPMPTRVDFTGGPMTQMPAESPSVIPIAQGSYYSQPESAEGYSEFAGPTPLGALIQYAMANNPQIQAARYHARARGARVPQAYSLPDPQLMTMVFLESIQTAAGPQEVAMSLSQKFPWFGKRGLRSHVAYHDAMAAYARVTATELKVIERVKRAYFDVYFLQNAIIETRALEPRLKEVVEIAQDKTRTALAGLESVLQAETELSTLKMSLIKLEQAKTGAQARLAGILHLPPQTRIEALPNIDQTEVARTVRLLVDLSESCQPELDASRREICRDQSAVDLACRDYWPDVTVGFNWYEIGSDGLSPAANGHDAYSVGVGVNLPLYRTRLDAAVREAQYKANSSRRRYAATRDQVQAEVQALYAQFTEQHEVLGILNSEILPRARQTLELSVEAYRLGRLEFQQLIDAYRTLLNYRIDYHKRLAVREQMVASLERAVGCAITGGPVGDQTQPQ